MNRKEYIKSRFEKILKENLAEKSDAILDRLNYKEEAPFEKPGGPFDYVQEGEGEMCEQCGSEMSEGECMECGTKSQGEVMELGGMDSDHPRFGKLNLKKLSKDDLDSINKRSKVDFGDILMPMIGTIGNPIIVKENEVFAIKNVALIKFRPDSRVINTYIKSLLESDYFENAVSGSKRGGTQKFISLGNIRTLPIAVPPIELQHQFAQIIQQVDKLKFAVQKSLDETQQLFDSLMQEYFG
jgi:restriction endonuclease S subunit